MAALGRDDGFGRQTANEATCAVEAQRRQNNDGIDGRSNDLDTKPGRRSQIYRRICLVESGFG